MSPAATASSKECKASGWVITKKIVYAIALIG
jgi:hypothetical protein